MRVEPSGIELDAKEGETVMAAALRLGYRWPTLCGGEAACAVCRMEVVSGEVQLGPKDDDEQETLDGATGRPRGEQVRLACQARVYGDVVVTKKGVKPAAN
ncbi:hypothetical protein BST14_24945 [Mycobacterium arosiense ATCC BAA-1401 = DSM 45069]|uniref:2Fe-2S ferredoxin-type domain-containing protein n=1 Tax=Mycobacterium arosiense ATCC BAA-1401 = DSM 45069 TaxID=1265311 RepID=A0A1W9Z7A0_MYCAI|nr:hypothetical protein BST14_24945 [Mycobacterium arosiense ATCC BAA-1401 = DSM 45069]